MARDYKHAGKKSSSPSGRSGSSGWAWFVVGLLIGLFITALTYLNMRHSVEDARRQVRAESQISQSREKPSKPVAKTAESTKSTNKKKPEPHFEFYTILPEREIRVPEYELGSSQPRKAKKEPPADQTSDPAPTSAPGRYILQVGSFHHLEDADRLKAKLALGGFDVEIQTISMNSGDTWHRVRLGPYQDLGVVHRIRSGLQKNGFAPLVLKEK
uniref:Sporulation related domain-containing protein n=1 Tax=Candidatus Kentrum sp. LPFa TaxID=2126335 RepID=A0A450WCX7_9GAMM|nr:MAG: Sporulation related domain-containing protein [Candidatus Kentron sp. LPFa]VFK30562.1 MAG: Sporulation related domain-containing protein [Candidatus Kentron sp. LPFa]